MNIHTYALSEYHAPELWCDSGTFNGTLGLWSGLHYCYITSILCLLQLYNNDNWIRRAAMRGSREGYEIPARNHDWKIWLITNWAISDHQSCFFLWNEVWILDIFMNHEVFFYIFWKIWGDKNIYFIWLITTNGWILLTLLHNKVQIMNKSSKVNKSILHNLKPADECHEVKKKHTHTHTYASHQSASKSSPADMKGSNYYIS